MSKNVRRLLVALIIGLFIFSYIGYDAIYKPVNETLHTNITLNIESGLSVSQIGEKLVRAKLIRNVRWFRVYTSLTGNDTKIKSGLYKIPTSMSLADIVEYITNNNQEVFYNPNKISIPEGLTLEQIKEKLIEAKLGTAQEIDAIFSNQSFIKEQLGLDITSLEGFIYPKTYYYEDDLSLRDFLIEYPLKEFKREFASYIEDSDFYHNLTLASIVEKESGTPAEKPIVASVFKNRLSKRMTLSSCATHNKIFYQQGKKPPLILRDKHLEIDSPYNTYMYLGLPPTPICSPSKESFEAVIFDAETEYLFFFADFKGNNIFSVTYQEHNAKKKSSWKSS